MSASAASDSPLLEARDLRVVRGGRVLAAADDLRLAGGRVHVLLGANGAGKSTLLRALNGLEAAEGELRFGGRPVVTAADRLALRRRTAAVFQKAYLLDTTVQGNVESGLRLRGVGRAAARRRAAEALELLGIAGLRDRRPARLSGGEAQRVSIARALAVDPEVLFFDEPLSSLDPPTREALVRDLSSIFDRSQMAVVWVTHDRDEALAVADVVSFLEAGRVVQSGRATEVFARPATTSFAAFLGLDAYLEGDGRHRRRRPHAPAHAGRDGARLRRGAGRPCRRLPPARGRRALHAAARGAQRQPEEPATGVRAADSPVGAPAPGRGGGRRDRGRGARHQGRVGRSRSRGGQRCDRRLQGVGGAPHPKTRPPGADARPDLTRRAGPGAWTGQAVHAPGPCFIQSGIA